MTTNRDNGLADYSNRFKVFLNWINMGFTV